ncbi:MAG: hypothetical protein HZA08_11540 [Nitrospirae bacterium]|nr:hypothetical protein [Nitrospirota bacterium]
MKMFPTLKYLFFIALLLTSFSCGQYAGNNDYAGGGIGGTGITGVSVGKITAIDLTTSSISVNGVAFSLNGTGITVNGTPAEKTNLKVGMIVKVDGEFDATGSTGKALTIDFENNLEGPVDTGSIDASSKTFKVLGKTIFVDTTTVFEGTASFDSLKEGNVVEVSGFEAVDGSIHATYIELKEETFHQGITQVELKGTISNVNTDLHTFVLNNITITYDGTKVNENVLTNGVNIEVKGIISPDNINTLVADKIELHNFTPSVKEGEKVEIEGYITELTPSTDTTIDFKVNNQHVHVDTSKTTFEHGTISDIQINTKVEVKGTIESGILNTTKVSIETEEHKETDKKHVEVSNTSNNAGTPNPPTNTNNTKINNDDTSNDTNVDVNPDNNDSQTNDSTINNSNNVNNNTDVANQNNSGDNHEDVNTADDNTITIGNTNDTSNSENHVNTTEVNNNTITDDNNNTAINSDKIDGEQTNTKNEEGENKDNENNDKEDKQDKKEEK